MNETKLFLPVKYNLSEILKEKAQTMKKRKEEEERKKGDYSPVYVRRENRHEFTAAVNPADGGI